MKKITIYFLLFFCFKQLQSQVLINKEWKADYGNPYAAEWSNFVVDESNNIFTVGNNFYSAQGANIYISKHNRSGQLIWETNYNSNNAQNDFGIAISLDLIGNVYIVGTALDDVTNQYDVITIKVNSEGEIIWSKIFNSIYNRNDVGTAIKISDDGNIFVAASSEKNSIDIDYLLLKYNSDGVLEWQTRYDFANLSDVPIGLELQSNNQIFIIGASARNTSVWDYTLAKFDNTGNYIEDVRNEISTLGFDKPKDFVKDNNGNIFITGQGTDDGINYKIRTIKININNIIEWVKDFDMNNLEEGGTSVIVDEVGNIIVGGFVTYNSGIKDLMVIKYNTAGTELWTNNSIGQAATLPMIGADTNVDLEKGENGDFYLIGSKKVSANQKENLLAKLKSDGSIKSRRIISKNENEKLTKLVKTSEGVYVSTLKDSTNNNYFLTKYTEHEINQNVVLNSEGNATHKANELIVRFKKTAINTDAIDDIGLDKKIVFNKLEYFLTPSAMQSFAQALNRLCPVHDSTNLNPCGIIAIKVFKDLKTTFTSTTNRLGETINVPDFWTAFVLEFPQELPIHQIKIALAEIPNVVAYSEPNYIMQLNSDSIPNDGSFGLQQSLANPYYEIPEETRPDINMLEAWDIFPAAGKPFVKVGVFDTGIDYRHPDFGYNTSNQNNWVVKGGYDYLMEDDIFANTNSVGGFHGTAIAGIIGAVRNNGMGIAGIAGGDRAGIASPASNGVSLYSLQMHPDSAFFGVMSDMNEAIFETSTLDSSGEKNYGLHVDNFSWGIPVTVSGWTSVNDSLITNINLLRETIHSANRANVIMCAARGNANPQANPNDLDNIQYPAMFNDDWILSIGGSGDDGRYAHSAPMGIGNGDTLQGNSNGNSLWGSGMDFIAPSNSAEIFTTSTGNSYYSFSGTSAATPHVAGLVALILSYHNSPIDSYQNLSQEDCENIIQMTCDLHPDSSGYTQKEGYGRINAGKAMRLIQKPIRQIKHFGNRTSPSSISITPLSVQEIFTEEIYQNYNNDWFPAGSYLIKPYKIVCTVQHSLQTNDSILSFWPRPSGSTVFSTTNSFVETFKQTEKFEINSLSNTSATMTGYHYQVFDLNSNFIGWWPQDVSDTSLIKFEYSILVEDTTAIDETSIHDNQIFKNIQLFPNPTSDKQTIILTNPEKELVSIKLFDFTGKLIRKIYQNNTISDKTIIDIDISNLAPSMYYYQINIGDKTTYLKSVKK